jgi:signal transduction histidine kinase
LRRPPAPDRILKLEYEDRRRIARELRESTSQELAALKINLAVIEKSGARLGSKAKKALAECLALAEGCSQEIRTLSHLLHPLLLEEFGLVSALRSYLKGFTKKSELRVHLAIDAYVRRQRLPREFETTLFLVVQEGLANVRLHSGSATAKIDLRRDPDSNEVVLKVRDSGHGIPAKVMREIKAGKVTSSGLGIPGMTDRVGQLGGRLSVETSKRGTVLTATLPLPTGKKLARTAKSSRIDF